MPLFDWMCIFYILEELQLYNQYLVIKMQSNANKISKIGAYCFLKLLNEMRGISSLLIHTQTFARWRWGYEFPLRCSAGLSPFCFRLSIRNVKHRRGFISSSWKGYIIPCGVLLRLPLKQFCRQNKLEDFFGKRHRHAVKNYRTVRILERFIEIENLDKNHVCGHGERTMRIHGRRGSLLKRLRHKFRDEMQPQSSCQINVYKYSTL